MNAQKWTPVAIFLVAILAAVGVVGWLMDAWFWGEASTARSTPPLARGDKPQSLTGEDSHLNAFVGARACAECHQQRYDEFARTAHHLTSRIADRQSILGSFASGKNVLQTHKENLQFVMEHTEQGLSQTAVIGTGEEVVRHSARFDIAIGSGKLGQSYLYWQESELYQLPISYFTRLDCWINSPGYPDGEADFSRPITPRCLECHSTYFRPLATTIHAYHPTDFVLGISCERCHGPGREHRDFHRANPDEDVPRHIVDPRELGRDRQLQICSQCHSGAGTSKQRPFSYVVGDALDDYFEFDSLGKQNELGVHSTNQLARLAQSACFQGSPEMTCTTCHNPHVNERGNWKVFSRRCQKCHEPQTCPQVVAHRLPTTNCIECHMPRDEDTGTQLAIGNEMEFPLLRDHVIGIYPRVAQEWIAEHVKEGREAE